MTKTQCTTRIGHGTGGRVADLTCNLPEGHQGFHEDQTTFDGTPVIWIPKHIGSTGYVSPRETWPDDTDINEAIAEAETIGEAIFEIAEKFDVPVTNNLPRWQEGRFVRHVGDFLEDLYAAFDRFMPIPISLANKITETIEFDRRDHDVTRQVWRAPWGPRPYITEQPTETK